MNSNPYPELETYVAIQLFEPYSDLFYVARRLKFYKVISYYRLDENGHTHIALNENSRAFKFSNIDQLNQLNIAIPQYIYNELYQRKMRSVEFESQAAVKELSRALETRPVIPAKTSQSISNYQEVNQQAELGMQRQADIEEVPNDSGFTSKACTVPPPQTSSDSLLRNTVQSSHQQQQFHNNHHQPQVQNNHRSVYQYQASNQDSSSSSQRTVQSNNHQQQYEVSQEQPQTHNNQQRVYQYQPSFINSSRQAEFFIAGSTGAPRFRFPTPMMGRKNSVKRGRSSTSSTSPSGTEVAASKFVHPTVPENSRHSVKDLVQYHSNNVPSNSQNK